MTLRSRFSLDGQWRFWMDPDELRSPSALDSDPESLLINVPAPWQSHSPELRNYMGVGWYQRLIELPGAWFEHKAIILGFGAVDYLAEVWLNGIKVGEHEGGYLPFEFDVTHAVRPGQNMVTVRVADPLDLFPEIPHGKQSWYGQISGLWQPVWIEGRSFTHILRVRITPQGEQVNVEVALNHELAPEDTLRFEIISPHAEIVSQAHSRDQQISLHVKSPLVWDVDSPHLYTLQVSLWHADFQEIDRIHETFGFRTIQTRDGEILLNGRPIYLRGALDQDYYPDLIYTPPTVEFIEDQFQKAKTMGLNCLRTHIKIADPRYYAAADRLGLLIWSELPNWEVLTPASRQRAYETLTGMIERDWNHPSIIIWTIINESWGVDLTNEEHCAWLSETYDTVKNLDPHRLIVGNSACYTNFHVVTDIEDFHNYASLPDHYLKWRKWVRSFASRPAWSFAHLYESYPAWRKYLRKPWAARPRPPAPSVRRRGDEPLVVSEFGNWGLPDVDQLRECFGGQEPWWFETGFEGTEGIVYPHGFEQRFLTYHLDRAFSSIAELSVASQKMQFLALKYEIEQLRRFERIKGYIITEFTDVHWESNGLLDMCRNPKIFFEEICKINNPDLIIPDWQRVAYWEGERCEVSLVLSHFSAEDLHGSRLVWQLEGWPDIHGAFDALAPQPTKVTRLGKVSFSVPPVTTTRSVRLILHLVNRHGKPVATNHQDLYFFPRHASRRNSPYLYAPTLAEPLQSLGFATTGDLDSAHLALVDVMTDDLRNYLQRGGRVIWLAEGTRSQQTYLGDLKIKPRKGKVWQGDWANNLNWINQDKIFASIPTDGLVDFAFAGLTPDHVITGLKPLDFASDVHAGLFVGWLHRVVALVAERRVGRGRILISTFRLRQNLADHPLAALMVQEMVEYMAVPETDHNQH